MLSPVSELYKARGVSWTNADRCFLKYTVPTRRMKARNPVSILLGLVSAKVPGKLEMAVMNQAFSKKWRIIVTLPIPAKNET